MLVPSLRPNAEACAEFLHPDGAAPCVKALTRAIDAIAEAAAALVVADADDAADAADADESVSVAESDELGTGAGAGAGAGGRGLHSLTSQLNLSALYGIGGARRGCVARVRGVLEGVQGV
jgi:hypothetical protein